jgi:uncharacterized Zn finger protein (UPF0148 family)
MDKNATHCDKCGHLLAQHAFDGTGYCEGCTARHTRCHYDMSSTKTARVQNPATSKIVLPRKKGAKSNPPPDASQKPNDNGASAAEPAEPPSATQNPAEP